MLIFKPPLKALLSLLFICNIGLAKCQVNDFHLMLNGPAKDTGQIVVKRQTNYIFKDKNWIIKYNPIGLFFGYALYFYQKVISPQIVMGCLYYPSCSNFSKGCIHEFGFTKGIFLSTDRLTRCTRLSAIDIHPVLYDKNNKVVDLPQYYRIKKNK